MSKTYYADMRHGDMREYKEHKIVLEARKKREIEKQLKEIVRDSTKYLEQEVP